MLVQAVLSDVEVCGAKVLKRNTSLVQTKDQKTVGMTCSSSAVTQYLAQERGNITPDLGARHLREPRVYQSAVGPGKKVAVVCVTS